MATTPHTVTPNPAESTNFDNLSVGELLSADAINKIKNNGVVQVKNFDDLASLPESIKVAHVGDAEPEEDLKEVTRLLNKKVIVFSGDQSPQILDTGFELIVLSPGVPQSIPLVVEARRREIPVISEVELAFGFIKGKIVAITGTDGKSTTTSLVGHVLKEIGIKTFVGGNIGIPLVSFVCDTDDDSVTVLGLSSFQLETIVNFKPDVAAILNVSPDHLDRYDSMNDYFSAKLNISKKQTDEDFFIYYKDDDLISKGIDIINADMLDFSLNDENSASFSRMAV